MEFTAINWINQDFFAHFMGDFGETTVSFGLLIEGVACGAAQFTITGQTAILSHIDIAPVYRRQGGGTFLIQKSRKQLISCGVVQLLCHPTYAPWDDHYYLNFFLTSCGFQNQGEVAWVYTMPLKDLASRLMRPTTEKSIVPLTHFPQDQWAALAQTLPPAQQTFDFDHPDFLPHLSMVVIEQKKLVGFLMVQQKEPLLIEVAGLCYTGNDPTMLGRLLSATAAQAVTQVPLETTVITMVNNPNVVPILERILRPISHSKQPVHQFAM